MSIAESNLATNDIIDYLIGIEPTSPLHAVRALRPDVVQYTQGSYDALLTPADPGDLSLVERAQAALRTAALTPNATLVAHYRARLAQLGEADTAIDQIEQFTDGITFSPRTAAILHHVNLLTTAPDTATPAHLQKLQSQGLSVRAIVALSQLIAFVSYQARVIVALQLLGEAAA